MADEGLVFTVDGKRHELNVVEITGREAKAFRDATGIALRRAFAAFAGDPDSVDLDTVAGIVWLARRQGGEEVAYDDVLGSISYGTDFSAVETTVDAPQL